MAKKTPKSRKKSAKKETEKNVYEVTWAKKIEAGFGRDGLSGAVILENVDGAKFGSLLNSQNALDLLCVATELCKSMPAIRPNSDDSEAEKFVASEVDDIAITPGRNPPEICLQVFSGGLRLSFWIDLDLFLRHCAELARHIERNLDTPSSIQ